jgi:hypothetical protein
LKGAKSIERQALNPQPEGRGNDALWKAWENDNRFPTLPPALGNRCRDSHITHGHDDEKEYLSKPMKPKPEQ